MKRRPLYVGVFLTTDRHKGATRHAYAFSAGTEKQIRAMGSEQSPLIGVKKAIPAVQKALAPFMPENGSVLHIGGIDYLIHSRHEKQTATSHEYYPKAALEEIGKEAMKKSHPLGSYLELLTTRDLEKKGVTHVRTTYSPSPARRRQLVRCELPTYSRAPIGKWIAGLGRDVAGKTGPISFWRAIGREFLLNLKYRFSRTA